MIARATTEMTMATGDEIKLPLTSRDVNADRLAQFRELFPEASTEGKFDLQKLAQLLGEAATDAPERYGLSWSGKSEAIRAIQTTSPGTLAYHGAKFWLCCAPTRLAAPLGPRNTTGQRICPPDM